MYYLINDETKRVTGVSTGQIEPMPGITVFCSETNIENYSDYILKNEQLVYEPLAQQEVKTSVSTAEYANAGKILYGQVTDEEYAKAAKILLEGEA